VSRREPANPPAILSGNRMVHLHATSILDAFLAGLRQGPKARVLPPLSPHVKPAWSLGVELLPPCRLACRAIAAAGQSLLRFGLVAMSVSILRLGRDGVGGALWDVACGASVFFFVPRSSRSGSSCDDGSRNPRHQRAHLYPTRLGLGTRIKKIISHIALRAHTVYPCPLEPLTSAVSCFRSHSDRRC